MPGDPNECRDHARNCLRLAEFATSREATRIFVDLAHSWTKLAIDLENAQNLLIGDQAVKRADSTEASSR